MISKDTTKRMMIALTSEPAGQEVIDALNAAGALAPAADVAAIATPNASTQTASYVQADVQSIATLANANKAAINAILAALKAAGLML